PTHSENVRERVGGGDLSVRERIVYNGREKIDGLHECTIAIQAINTGIVERGRVHDYVSVQGKGKLRQNLSQGLLAQFGSSPGTGRKRSKFSNLFTRHRCHPLSPIADCGLRTADYSS